MVLGSRMLGESPLKFGMPWWKYLANRGLTFLENLVFGIRLSEYHMGYRAYRREVLEIVNFAMNSDKFVSDQEIVAQIAEAQFRIHDVPVPTRYFPEASSADLLASCRYGLDILWLLFRLLLHRSGLLRQKQFESLSHHYRRL